MNAVPSTSCLLSLCVLAFACSSPADQFNQFTEDVIDAAERPDAPPVDSVPDITGEFYLSYSPSSAPSELYRFINTVTLTHTEDGGATMDMSSQPLDYETLEPVGDPLVSTGIDVSGNAEFLAEFQGIFPARSDPILNAELTATITLEGEIRNENLFCGPAGGEVTKPTTVNLEGSTFGAIRIEEGTTGEDLPEPVFDCPAVVPPDAGVPDAAPPIDAAPDGAPDAAPDPIDAGDAG